MASIMSYLNKLQQIARVLLSEVLREIEAVLADGVETAGPTTERRVRL